MTEAEIIDNIPELRSAQKSFFTSQQTKDISFRKQQLKKLLNEVIKREKDMPEEKNTPI